MSSVLKAIAGLVAIVASARGLAGAEPAEVGSSMAFACFLMLVAIALDLDKGCE